MKSLLLSAASVLFLFGCCGCGASGWKVAVIIDYVVQPPAATATTPAEIERPPPPRTER